MPSAQMLLADVIHVSTMHQHNLYIQRPLNIVFSQFPGLLCLKQFGKHPVKEDIRSPCPGYIFCTIDPQKVIADPFWGNNWEASSSVVPMVTKRLFRMDDVDNTLTGEPDPNEEINSLDFDQSNSYPPITDDTQMQLALFSDVSEALSVDSPQHTHQKKRRSRKRPTPIVDDEVRRSTRLNKTVDDGDQLQQALEVVLSEGQMLPIDLMQNLATTYCEVAPGDVTVDKLLSSDNNDNV
jgi:hypothetical protein